jgi:hypothetical protein
MLDFDRPKVAIVDRMNLNKMEMICPLINLKTYSKCFPDINPFSLISYKNRNKVKKKIFLRSYRIHN